MRERCKRTMFVPDAQADLSYIVNPSNNWQFVANYHNTFKQEPVSLNTQL
jgi:hypothetical protein